MSENNEEIDDYAAQDLEIMNTMEATKHFYFTTVESILDRNYNFD